MDDATPIPTETTSTAKGYLAGMTLDPQAPGDVLLMLRFEPFPIEAYYVNQHMEPAERGPVPRVDEDGQPVLDPATGQQFVDEMALSWTAIGNPEWQHYPAQPDATILVEGYVCAVDVTITTGEAMAITSPTPDEALAIFKANAKKLL